MPSSPERFEPAVLPELSRAIHRPPFELAEASTVVADRLALFELGTTAGIPQVLLEPARKAAEAAGYAAGWAVGTRAAHFESEERAAHERAEADRRAAADRARVDQALAALAAAADAMHRRQAPAWEDIESLILTSAFDIAEAVIGTVLRDDTVRGAAALRRALALVPSDDAVVVRVHPADHAILTRGAGGIGAAGTAAAGTAAAGGRTAAAVTLVADETLSLGDAVATCGPTTVDARVADALARVRALLGDAGTGAAS